MGKSSTTTTTTTSSTSPASSCFKIIACGSHDADVDDDAILSPQAKASSNKRGWSFRKRSGRHRAVGDNVSSETAAVNNKETPQGIHTEYQVPDNSKSSEEKSQMSKPAEKTAKVVFASELVSDTKPSMTVASDNDGSDEKAEAQAPLAEMVVENVISCNDIKEAQVPESEVIEGNVVDATTAEEKMATPAVILENDDSVVVPEVDSDTDSAEPNTTECVIALEIGDDDGPAVDDSVAIIIQTAIRGFLAQRAITQLKSAVKLQAAIRGHLVRRNAVETLHCIRAIVKFQSLVRARSFKSLDHGYKPNNAQFSTVKLLQNSFTRQLLESTPKTKPVNIRCDPLNPNSAWGWLERWMAVSASEADQKSIPVVESRDDNQHQETAVPANANLDRIDLSDSVALKCNVTDVAPPHDTEESHIVDDVSVEDSVLCNSSYAEVEIEQTPETFEDDGASKMDVRDDESSHVQEEVVSVIDKPTLESMERPASEELDGDGKRFAFGSRKASNPAFIAAQSKFEEMSTATKFGRSLSSSHQDVSPESDLETVSSVDEASKKSNEPAIVEASLADKKTNELIVNETAPVHLYTHVAGSECGTELSISSTLDSPVRSDTGNADSEQNKLFDEASHEPDTREGSGDEVNGVLRGSEEEARGVDISSDLVVADINSEEEQKIEMNAPELQTNIERVSSVMITESSQLEQTHEVNDLNTHQGDKLSPEASPKSHRTVPDSYGTPSSQVSVKSKKSKTDKSGSNTKRSSLSGGKRTPSKPDVNSVVRSSTENLAKDHKNGKRRNSFGSSKSDNADQEARESSACSSLPSYMQATESARAKAHSPRSSPDVHDKEVSGKKRHSLPGPSGRQESPRIQRSASQAAQGAKANGSNERKWQR